LTPAIGTEIKGLDLRQLTDEQKDELYVFLRLVRDVMTFYGPLVLSLLANVG
jgi:hypothetical protein